MLFGQLEQAWSAFDDHIQLNSELEGRLLLHLFQDPNGEKDAFEGISEATALLRYASTVEIGDYFLERRDYVESMAVLDIIISVERAIRVDLAQRNQGVKDATSTVGAALMTVAGFNGQPPAARPLLKRWRLAAGAIDTMLDAVDEGMQYRNWLVHGTLGPPPFSPSPYLLHAPVAHLLELIDNEP